MSLTEWVGEQNADGQRLTGCDAVKFGFADNGSDEPAASISISSTEYGDTGNRLVWALVCTRGAGSKVPDGALEPHWDFDNNLLNQTTNDLQKQNWISYGSYNLSLRIY